MENRREFNHTTTNHAIAENKPSLPARKDKIFITQKIKRVRH